jgi:KDO2-lipid IV(A) lauroyltransferase
MFTLFKLLCVLPLSVLHLGGAALGWLVFGVSPRYRQRFLANAAQAGYSFAQVRAAVGHAGRMVAELPRLWLGAMPACDWDNVACIDEAYSSGKGVLFLTPHLGCFEITAQALAQRYHARFGPLTVLFRPARKPWMAPVMQAARQRPGLETVPTTLAGVRQMLKALRQGRAIGLLPDQVPPGGLGVWAPFFGVPAYTMTLAARLVQQTGSGLLLVWGERLPRGAGYRVRVSELGEPLPADPAEAAAAVNRAMERLILQCPGQYLWGYHRYKSPREIAKDTHA